MKSNLPRSCRGALFAGALALVSLTDAHAALTWNNAGASNNWSTAAGNGNWLPGNVVWTNGEDAIFGATPEVVSVTTANTVDDITFQGSWTIGNGIGNLTLADSNSDITVDPSFTAVIQETVAGTGNGITKLGTGTLAFTNNLSYTGPTIINEGVFQLNSAITSTTTFTVNSGGTLRYASSTNWTPSNNAITLAGGTLSYVGSDLNGRYVVLAATVAVNSASAMTVSTGAGAGVGSNVSNLFVDGALTGSAPLTITSSTNGRGVSLRSGASTYSGTITVNGNASAVAGTGSGLTIGLGANSSLANADIVVNGMFDLGNAGAHMTWGNGAVSGTTFLMDALGGSGVVVANMGTAGSTRTISVGNNGGGDNFSGAISNGANNTLSLIKNGAGTQILSGANSFTGTMTINNGILQIGNAGTSGTLGSGAVSIASGATLAFNRSDAYTVANAISGLGGVTQNGAGTLTFSTAKTYTGATVVNSGAITHTAAVTNATNYSGVGTVNFNSGSSLGGSTVFGSSFTGQINVNTDLNIANAANIFTNNRGDLNVALGTTFAINGVTGDATGPTRQFDELTGSGAISNGAVASVAPATLTIGANNGNGGMAVFSGNISSSSTVNGRISIIKNGSGSQTLSGDITTGTGTLTVNGGTLVLSGTNTYSGGTTINGGVLLVNNASGSGLGTSNIVVDGGRLGGTGAFTGTVTVNSGGTLAPGASIESLASGTLSLNGGSTFAYEYDTGVPLSLSGDLQKVTGNLNLSGTVALALSDLSLTSSPDFANGTILSLINYSGTWNGGLFTFSGNELSNGEIFAHGSYFWQIDYNVTSGGLNFASEYLAGRFINLTVMGLTVPEPSSWLLCTALGACVMFSIRRVRRR